MRRPESSLRSNNPSRRKGLLSPKITPLHLRYGVANAASRAPVEFDKPIDVWGDSLGIDVVLDWAGVRTPRNLDRQLSWPAERFRKLLICGAQRVVICRDSGVFIYQIGIPALDMLPSLSLRLENHRFLCGIECAERVGCQDGIYVQGIRSLVVLHGSAVIFQVDPGIAPVGVGQHKIGIQSNCMVIVRNCFAIVSLGGFGVAASYIGLGILKAQDNGAAPVADRSIMVPLPCLDQPTVVVNPE